MTESEAPCALPSPARNAPSESRAGGRGGGAMPRDRDPQQHVGLGHWWLPAHHLFGCARRSRNRPSTALRPTPATRAGCPSDSKSWLHSNSYGGASTVLRSRRCHPVPQLRSGRPQLRHHAPFSGRGPRLHRPPKFAPRKALLTVPTRATPFHSRAFALLRVAALCAFLHGRR